MRMLRVTGVWLCLVVIALPGMTGQVWAETVRARLGTSLPDAHPQTLGARRFAEIVEARSEGRIRIRVHSSGQLGSDQQMQNALRAGTQQFTVPSTATLANLVPAFGIIGTPFAFQSEVQADAVLDGPFGRHLLDQLPAVGMVGLAFWENGFRNLTNSRRQVSRLEDIAGLKVRTMQNAVYIDMFNGMGANAVPMAVTELFTALETRAVDGQENPYTVVHAQRFYDVQKYLSTTRHAYDAQVLVASRKFWDGLSEADRRLIQEAAREAALFQRQKSRALNTRLREELASLGMQIHEVSEEERARMRERLRSVVARHRADFGEETVKRFGTALQESATGGRK